MFKRLIRYLGLVVSAEGIATDPDKISAVKDGLFLHVNVSYEVLGLASYYHKFVVGFSSIASPLNVKLGKLHNKIQEVQDNFSTVS